MKTLTPEQMDTAQKITPVAMKTQDTPGGIVTFTVTPTEGRYALASTPFEVIGAHEGYSTIGAAIARMLSCAEAVAHDRFPTPARQEVIAA